MELRNRLAGLGAVGHFDKAKAAGAAGLPVGGKVRTPDGSVHFEELHEMGFRGAPGDIPNENPRGLLPSWVRLW